MKSYGKGLISDSKDKNYAVTKISKILKRNRCQIGIPPPENIANRCTVRSLNEQKSKFADHIRTFGPVG